MRPSRSEALSVRSAVQQILKPARIQILLLSVMPTSRPVE
jgi:hypothetical protein